ncbi:DUF885 family protein [Acetobacteraceae bacterium KSS8]|uniref:DUF885 family protein n=1 Tax=Endosaccharibacter trunci TaxID=2812733 RepID=A0ABT1W900_9PROT|nr:DUF885 family protein [Acetobacteraceae bacterium KSS8]
MTHVCEDGCCGLSVFGRPDTVRFGRRKAAVLLASSVAGLVLNAKAQAQDTKAAPAAAPESGTPSQRLAAVIAEYDRIELAGDPIDAGQRGDAAARRRWPDNSPAATKTQEDALRACKRRLDAIGEAGLSPEEKLNRALLQWRLGQEVDGFAFDENRIPFSADDGFFLVPGYAAESTVIHDEAEARDWIARLRAVPSYYDREIANMRRGIADRFTQPRLVAEKAAATVNTQLATKAENSPLLAPIGAMPATIPAATRTALRAEAVAAIRDAVQPAQRTLAVFFRDTYIPAARTTLGVSSLPDGRAYYSYRVRDQTTTDMTPDQVFDLGQSEVRRIHAAMLAEIAASGFKGDFPAFLHFLRTDKQFYVTTREALMEKASRLAKRVDGQLPHFFRTLPRLTYGVVEVPREIEEGYTSGRAQPGDPRQGIAAELLINTSHLDQRPLYELPSLVAHEGAPGHYLQIALAQELTDLPNFRQQSDITAYVEGWAVYCEQLVREFGLYETPYQRFGMLSMEMWRACRLVIDVGIHWKNWSRDQAVAYLRENTALAEKNIQNEVDRYIAWPGQALGYKIGQLRISALRAEAETRLGPNFDLRRFHDVILVQGAMPLSILSQQVQTWIAGGGK